MSLYAQNTKVPIAQSRMEIERMLERHKAKQFGTAVDNDLHLARVQFRLHDRNVRFTIALPDPAKLGRGGRFEQAERQRWRALLLVLKAKLESIENKIATFEEEFLAHIVMPDGHTVAEHVIGFVADAYKLGRMPEYAKQLGPGPEAD
jgi:hypothetical protein